MVVTLVVTVYARVYAIWIWANVKPIYVVIEISSYKFWLVIFCRDIIHFARFIHYVYGPSFLLSFASLKGKELLKIGQYILSCRIIFKYLDISMMITNIYSINDVNSTNIIINSIINSVSITSFKDNNINNKNSTINNTNIDKWYQCKAS